MAGVTEIISPSLPPRVASRAIAEPREAKSRKPPKRFPFGTSPIGGSIVAGARTHVSERVLTCQFQSHGQVGDDEERPIYAPDEDIKGRSEGLYLPIGHFGQVEAPTLEAVSTSVGRLLAEDHSTASITPSTVGAGAKCAVRLMNVGTGVSTGIGGGVKPITSTGVLRFVVVPSPSCL